MRFISSSTLEQLLKREDFLSLWTFKDAIKCLFAVASGLSYLHSHLISHGNLCPSNIIIDLAKQCYLSDFGLYPIKNLYINQVNMCNVDYKDPFLKNDHPAFKNDVYSFGVLICQFCLIFYPSKKGETLHTFLAKNDPNKYHSFPPFFSELILECMNSSVTNRPTMNEIIDKFKTAKISTDKYNIQNLYNKFVGSKYIVNLAKLNDSFALNKLGEMYEKGDGFEKDIQKALFYFEKAALLNNTEAKTNYGVLLQKVANQNNDNLVKGAAYLKVAAENGNIHGMAKYGVALQKGEGVEIDIQKAEDYLKKSADLDYSYAQLHYGLILIENDPTPERVSLGLKYIQMSICQEYPDAYFEYGVLLQLGQVVDKNEELAMKYFKIAADMGNEEAIVKYADGNYYGNGIEKNNEIALKYYLMALEKGNLNVLSKIELLNSSQVQQQEQESVKNNSDRNNQMSSSTSSDDETISQNKFYQFITRNKDVNVKENENENSKNNDNNINEEDQQIVNKNKSKQNISFDLNSPTEELIKKGDLFLSENDFKNAFLCYEACANKGEKDFYLKCARIGPDFDTKIKYFEMAIECGIEDSLKEWRNCIIQYANESESNEFILECAKRLEKRNYFLDAAYLYKKGGDLLNFHYCSEKAGNDIQINQDVSKPNDFGHLLKAQKDDEVMKMNEKAEENVISDNGENNNILLQNQTEPVKKLTEAESFLLQGICYFEGKDQTEADLFTAFQNFSKASELGCPKADFYLGNFYKNGFGILQIDPIISANYYKKSAEAGDTDGQNAYADCLRNGFGVYKNFREALLFYKRAAAQGSAIAAFNYGKEMYETSLINKEKEIGLQYLKKAADNLFPDAIYLYSKGIRQTDPEEAKKLYRFSIEKGSEMAINDFTIENNVI